MRRVPILVGVASLLIVLGASASGAKVHLEIWGLVEGDEARIDDQAVTVRGGPPRPFLGDPAADDAPVLTEVGVGTREITLERRAGAGGPWCATETFKVVVEGKEKKAVVMGKVDPVRCTLPELPPRR